MPKVCAHFRDLESRVRDLTTKFVADQIVAELGDPAGFAPDLDRLAAFRLLAHAEVEEFLEAKARDGLTALGVAIAVPGLTLRALSNVFPLAGALGRPFNIVWPFDTTRFLAEVGDSIRGAEQSIVDNNGVKGGSFFLLSLMAGKWPDEVDQALGSSLTSYGKSRGDVAHKSVARVRTLQAPSAEAKAVGDLVTALGAYFDVASA